MNFHSPKDIEIMAPVGSYESLMAAIQGGAGSVYFGLEKLNMRSRSSHNFTIADVKKIVSTCNKHQVKTYVTINTVLYNEDIPYMKEIVDACRKEGITAVIASDIMAIEYARSQGVEVHISTQLNVSNWGALTYYSRYADIVVLARELTLDQVKEIHQQIIDQQIKGPSGKLVRIEMFIHGALCMAVSGKCYLSLHEMNASANRGACMQICRRSYIVTDKETGQELEVDNERIMSPKDLCTIHFLNKMLDAGVSVLKIEGRARSPEYVKTVVECYREAVESIFDGSYSESKINDWTRRLSTVFNRGFWDGYYLGQRLGEWTHQYGSNATKQKIYLGKGINYFSNLQVAEFKMETGELSVGDEILITGPTTGVIQTKVKEIRVDMESVKKTLKGENFSIPLDMPVRRSDKLYKMVTAEKLK